MELSNRIGTSFLKLLFGLLIGAGLAAKATANDVTQISAETCKGCHLEIYEQWAGSMHANSSALKDPIHGAFYQAVVGDPTQEGVRKGPKKLYPVCLQCHAPIAALAQKTKLDSKPIFNEGVTCVSCHTMATYKGVDKKGGGLQLGSAAYEFSTTHLQGPSIDRKTTPSLPGAAAEPFHPLPMQGNPAVLKTEAGCMGCHDQRPNSKSVPLCMTGDEVRASGGATTCQNCHMPVVNGKTSHAMLGGHDPAMVEQGLAMTLQVKPDGQQLQAELVLLNKTPHRYPTGAPFRNLVVTLKAYNDQGELVWSNAADNPFKTDPKAVLWYKLGDQAGKPAPPPKATQVLADTRLTPNESRQLNYAIPAEGVVLVRAEANYSLLLPPIIKKFGDKLPSEAKQAQLVGAAEVRM